MAKKEASLTELTRAFSEILRVSKEHSYLWDEADLIRDNYLGVAGGFISQDELFHIGIRRKDNKLYIEGKNFGCAYGQRIALTARQAAISAKADHFIPELLLKSFYSSLQEPLGKYLAKKALEGKV